MPKPVDPTVDKYQQPVLSEENALKLVLFEINLSGGATHADVPGNIQATWDENVRLATKADEIGFDAIIPVARWRGYGGPSNFGGRSFETFTWATGLLSVTKRIQVFATFHVPIAHPLLAAKMATTADHISGGRFGLNIVAGWNQPELAMFGISQKDHDERYEVADEWTQILKNLWLLDGDNDFHGRYFDVPGGFLEPKPLQKPYPAIMNAGKSPAGLHFAAKHSDIIFTSITDLDSAAREVSDIKRLARNEYGREIAVFCRAHIVMRDTEREALEYYDYVNSQLEATDGAPAGRGGATGAAPKWSAEEKRTIEARRSNFGSTIVGDPDQVAERLLSLNKAGVGGFAVSWVNYDEGLDQMRSQILPRLTAAGVRTA